jgi:hypothetical protein
MPRVLQVRSVSNLMSNLVSNLYRIWRGYNFLYGFKGARLRLPPGAGRARRGIELETRSAVAACVGSASVTTWARA